MKFKLCHLKSELCHLKSKLFIGFSTQLAYQVMHISSDKYHLVAGVEKQTVHLV